MWRDEGGTDKAFVDRFKDVFPRGFIRRDINRAKNVIYDLYDIAVSPVIRFELSPINTYVLYGLVEGWFLAWSGEKEILCVPRGLKTYLRKNKLPSKEIELIADWFTDINVCLTDFTETYNGDYISERFAEEVAGLYLTGGSIALTLQILDVSIDEFFDLLPNDLRDKCIQRYESEKKLMKTEVSHENRKRQGTIVFISYSWDNDKHKKWVLDLSKALRANGISTVLDQTDLVLGDPLPQFMEQSIMTSDYVLIICTPKYKQKADTRKGGVGYEESIICGDVLATQNNRKYITVLAEGTWDASTPIWANGKYGIDLSDRKLEGNEFEKLVKGLTISL